MLAACSVASILILAAGLLLQHGFGLAPCAWCVLQRLIFLAIAVVSAIGALSARGRSGQLIFGVLVDALAMAGAAAALHLHFVASRSESCGLTLADQVIMKLSLHELAPWMFFADAPCNQANMPFLGLPFAIWSLLAFAVLGAFGVVVMLGSVRRQ